MNGGERRFWEQFDCADEDVRFFFVTALSTLSSPARHIFTPTAGTTLVSYLHMTSVQRDSWEYVHQLYNTVHHHPADKRGIVPVLILGLQADQGDAGRRVARSEAETFASERDCYYRECSALTGEGVYDAFALIVQDAYLASVRYGGDSARLESRKNQGREEFRSALDAIHR